MSAFDFFKSGWKRSVHLEEAALFPLAPDSKPYDVKGGVRHPDMPTDFYHHFGWPHQGNRTDLAYLEAQAEPTARLEGRGLYAGPFFRHYGHFLAESIHRLWAWMQEPDAYDYIAVLPQMPNPRTRPESVRDLISFQKDILAYMGVPLERLKLVLEPVIAPELTVPRQASLFGPFAITPKSYIDFWANHADRFFAAHPDGADARPEKLYVSRVNFLPRGSFAGERYIERLFADAGFHIMRPEALPLLEQLRLYRGARLIVFAEGSAFHTLELLGPLKADVVCLLRRPDTRDLWKKLLANRCVHASYFDKAKPLPSLVASDGDAPPASGMSLSLIDGPALVEYLRASGVASLNDFDTSAFQEAEAADIARHLVNVPLGITLRSGRLAECFTAFRKALADHDNPYLKESL